MHINNTLFIRILHHYNSKSLSCVEIVLCYLPKTQIYLVWFQTTIQEQVGEDRNLDLFILYDRHNTCLIIIQYLLLNNLTSSFCTILQVEDTLEGDARDLKWIWKRTV